MSSSKRRLVRLSHFLTRTEYSMALLIEQPGLELEWANVTVLYFEVSTLFTLYHASTD